MTRLENVINQVKDSRTGKNHAWIFNDDGKIGDNVVCGEVLDLLEELKEYEINVSDAWIENFLHNPRVKGDNTYNFNANISNNINIDYLVADDGAEIMVIMVHLTGDIRGNYTDYFAVKFDGLTAFMHLILSYSALILTIDLLLKYFYCLRLIAFMTARTARAFENFTNWKRKIYLRKLKK